MTSQEPTYLSQGVNYLGFLSQQLGDLRGITALAHELIQNADDAKDDSEKLSATRISFDFRDDALVVSNDSSFRQIDFDRIREVASGSKRSEAGARTTGAFGVGFISVYQVTDRPEIHSAGRRWTIRPDKEYKERILQVEEDPSITKGTRFILPWAFQDSRVRQELRAPTVKRESIETFVEDLRQSFPKAILFLKKLEMLELFRNGSLVLQVVVRRKVERKYTQVDCNNAVQRWRILEGDFSAEARKLKDKYGVIEANRSPDVQLAIPDSPTDTGLLFATLPTKLSTNLPFHIDADFFPNSDRKSIVFGDHDDPRSEWNRAALRVAASTVERNLIPIRDMFTNDASKFWAILDQLYAVHNEGGNDWRMPLGAFWECLVPSLGKTPIVYSESGKWLPPSTTCIPSMREEKAVPAFKALGIHLVQRNLWKYRNVLIMVGVRRLTVKDIYDALKNRDLIERPQTAPADFEVGLLWQGIHGVLDNTNPQLKNLARSQLRECSLAPGLDGRMWPCRSAFQSDCQTRQLFDSLLPNDVTFLAQEDVPLLQQLCPLFTPNDAINVLECLDSDVLQARWRHGDFDPTELLQWFDDNKSNLTEESLDRLAKLPIFPSAKNLHPLEDLWLPGGFDDPTGVADLLDMSVLEGLSDFLQFLGVKKLTFEEYAMRYIAEAFAVGSAESIETKRKHLENLERYIGEIRDNQELRKNLAVTNIVECIDCVFRQPSKIYFPCEEVKEILGDHTNYASLPQQSEGRRDLYRWLGVKTRPRIKDMLRIIEKQTRKPPDSEARATVVRLFVAIGKDWPDLDDNAKVLCNRLRTKKWLPAECDTSKWYSPDLLAATFNKFLFASQAKFIDVPYREQQSVSEFMKFLRVQLSPQPRQVVDHLLMCSIEFNQKPPGGVYQWLNDNAKGGDFGPLKEAACLWVKGKYLRPAQVFWGRHSFGRFRVQLGSEFKAFQYLLNELGIREAPDFNDAIEVLKDVSKSVGTKRLQPDDKDVVLQCWVMLSEALHESDLDAKNLRNRLCDTESIPNDDGKLHPPSWMFFEDRPGLADKFPDQLRGNCIPRIERVWTAMAAAGVKPISQVVKAEIHEFVDPAEDEETAKRFTQRATLINTILSKLVDGSQSDVAAVSLDKIRFFRTGELNVKWRLHALNRNRKWWPPTPPEPVKAFFDSGEKTIYFTAVRDKDYPWSAIARELSFAVAPDEDASSIAPGLKVVLEAPTLEDAITQVRELGIAPLQELGNLSDQGESVNTPDDWQAVESRKGHLSNSGNGSVLPPPLGPEWQDEPEVPFALRFYESQTVIPSKAPDHPSFFADEGPLTARSAARHTRFSGQLGRTGAHVRKSVNHWEPTEAAKNLADEFRSMVHGDYGRRCQICGNAFLLSYNQLQVYVVHVVPPSGDRRTNHLGDLLGLCGWHYSLVRYGEWALLDPETNRPFENAKGSEGWERMRTFISTASQETDEEGNSYIGLPVRFSNVYQKWNSEPAIVDEQIRYCIPHWMYLCELLKT